MKQEQQEMLNVLFLGCECKSYNGDFGETPAVKLKMPIYSIPAGEPEQVEYKDVMIDACIAPVLKHLWANRIDTLSCCCGHNGKFGGPTIVLAEGVDNYRMVRKLIAEVDPRNFELSQWKRVIV